MIKKILNVKEITILSKNEQKSIAGGRTALDESCYEINNATDCNARRDCQWFGCYCGPNYPHIAPC